MLTSISRSVVVVLAIATAALSPALSSSPDYPDLSITPGKARPNVTVEELCGANWSTGDRPVSAAMRRDVVAEYQTAGSAQPTCRKPTAKTCKIDRLIASKLGGADAEVNLWPQSTAGTWSASAKDKLEDCMHARICKRLAEQGADAATQLLKLYQHDLVNDWIAAFRNVIGEPTASCSEG